MLQNYTRIIHYLTGILLSARSFTGNSALQLMRHQHLGITQSWITRPTWFGELIFVNVTR